MRGPLLISHDLSYSGAPVALLSLAQSLKRMGEHPTVVTLSGGPLGAHYREAGIDLAQRVDPSEVTFVLANTVVSVPAALPFKKLGVPVAAWLHESIYFFQTVGVSPDDCGLRNLDVVLTPSKFQMEELQPFVAIDRMYQLRNAVKQEWFRPDAGESLVAVSGQWEKRKGQSQLLNLARGARWECRFKFIGATRPGYAVASIPPQHRFLGLLTPEKARLEIAKSDAIVSCAEAEVQPLSAIEAMIAGRPALLSDIPAHRALAEKIPNVFLFESSSIQSFEQGVQKLTEAIPNERTAAEQSRAAQRVFSEAVFEERLRHLVKMITRSLRPGEHIEVLQEG